MAFASLMICTHMLLSFLLKNHLQSGPFDKQENWFNYDMEGKQCIFFYGELEAKSKQPQQKVSNMLIHCPFWNIYIFLYIVCLQLFLIYKTMFSNVDITVTVKSVILKKECPTNVFRSKEETSSKFILHLLNYVWWALSFPHDVIIL